MIKPFTFEWLIQRSWLVIVGWLLIWVISVCSRKVRTRPTLTQRSYEHQQLNRSPPLRYPCHWDQ